ncbi:MAG: 50S ribosomal protein L1 [Candidatus Poribacteria bacterium]|nr:50S ribosomal protein L1 [Candidatus Poribacteria bacterium]
MGKSKRFEEASKQIDRESTYALEDAVKLLRNFPKTKFDQTVDLAIKLGVDPRQPDQNLRGTVDLPHGTGNNVRVVAFAEGEQARAAETAGAVAVGGDDLIARVQGGWLEFDAAVATPDLMPRLGRLGRVLGPRGLMPNPRTGTISTDLGPLVKAIQGGRIDYRVDKGGIIHAPVGKVSFEEGQLTENIRAVVNQMNRIKPAAAKGRYIQSVTLSPTMGPGIRLDLAQFSISAGA